MTLFNPVFNRQTP